MNEKNIQMTVENLASDHDFIQWVRRPNEQLNQYWDDWLINNPTKKTDLEKARELVDSIQFTDTTEDKQAENRVWEKINSSISSEEAIVKRMFPWTRVAMAVAAGLALLIGVNFLFFNDQVSISADMAQIIDHSLPDASIININADSKIFYSKKAWRNERTLKLEGEAFFSVEKGSAFVVETEFGTVSVLGTSFNVSTRDGLLEVKCLTGKVRVATSAKTVELLPGQGFVFNKDIEETKELTFNVAQGIAWRSGRYDFSNATLAEVISEVNRQFDVQVNISKPLLSRKYSGSFTNKDLNQALYDICWPMKLHFTVSGRKVTIREE